MSELKQVLTLYDLVVFGIGIIVGAGIYSLIGEATTIAGHGVWLSVLIAGFVSLLTGLSFAEMVGIYPSTHSYYQLLKNSLKIFGGKLWGFVVQWTLIFASIFAIVTTAIAFAGYLHALVSNFETITVSLSLIIISAIVSFIGIRQSSRLVVAMTLFELFGLFVVIIAGFFYTTLNYSTFVNFQFGPNIFLAAALIFFAYTGFELLPAQSEEAKSPRKYLPKAIVLAIVSSTIIYILVSIALSSLVNPNFGTSEAPLTDVITNVLGSTMASIVRLAALFATSSGVLGVLVAGSRLIYGLGKQKLIPKKFSAVFPRLQTPYIAIIGISVASMFFVLIFNSLSTVALLANFLTLLTFLLINISIIVLRVRKPDMHRYFKVPFAIRNVPIPSVVATISILLMLTQFSTEILAWGVEIVIAGIVFYFVVDKWKLIS